MSRVSLVTRTLAIAALMGATYLATPATPALAAEQPAPAAANPATSQRPESVEQRIEMLHAQLKITPEEESKWNSVAQAMRDNAASMEKLAAEKHQKGPQNMTAVDDLDTYRQFAQQHVDGLKNLTSAFKSLYSEMPDGQKKNADEVFANFHRNQDQGRG